MAKTFFQLLVGVLSIVLWVAALYTFVRFGFAINKAVGWLTLSVSLYLGSSVLTKSIGGDD